MRGFVVLGNLVLFNFIDIFMIKQHIMKLNTRLFKDILKENGMYSQGRVYLLWSVFAYYITLGTLLVAGIKKSEIG